MSQASRARRQHLLNRLEELDWKLGERDQARAPAPYTGGPSWGPLGARARAAMDSHAVDALVARDAETVALERTRAALEDGGTDMRTRPTPEPARPSNPPEVWARAT